MHILRWILLPVVCIAAWFAALFAGIIAHSVAESFCPQDQIISGMCVAPWFETLDAWLIRFFSAFAAALIISSAYFIAPAARHLVAWIVFAAGAVYALWIALVRQLGASLSRRHRRLGGGVVAYAWTEHLQGDQSCCSINA
jgi:hypothetical protein